VGVNPDILGKHHLVDPAFLSRSHDNIQSTRFQASLTLLDFWNKMEFNTFKQRPPAKVLVVGCQDELLTRIVVHELERTRADGVCQEVFIPHCFDGFFTDDKTAGIVGQLGKQEYGGTGFFQNDPNCISVGLFDGHTCVFSGVSAIALVRRFLQRVDHIFGCQFISLCFGAGMKHYAFAQLNRPDLTATHHFKFRNAFCQIRFDFRCVPRLITQQAVKNHVCQSAVLGSGRKMWVQFAHGTHMDPKPQHLVRTCFILIFGSFYCLPDGTCFGVVCGRSLGSGLNHTDPQNENACQEMQEKWFGFHGYAPFTLTLHRWGLFNL